MEKAGGEAAAFTRAVSLSGRAGSIELLDSVERPHPAEHGLNRATCVKPGHAGAEAAGTSRDGAGCSPRWFHVWSWSASG